MLLPFFYFADFLLSFEQNVLECYKGLQKQGLRDLFLLNYLLSSLFLSVT